MDDVPWAARNQRGVFTRAQARAEGWSNSQVKRRLAAGRWRVVAGTAVASATTEIGAWQLGFAVVLSWPGATISHQLAGSLWGFPVQHQGVGTATVGAQRGVAARGLRAFRSELRAWDIGRIGGLPVTTPTRTGVDLLASRPWPEARDLWAWLTTHGWLDLARLDEAIGRRAAMTGTPQLRRLLHVSAGGSVSAAEDLFHEILQAAGIAGWRANVRIRLGTIAVVADVLFDREKVVVEVDGWRSHSDRRAFQDDRTRQNALMAAGYVVLRLTWSDLTERPAYVVRTVRAALARAGAS